MPTKYDVRKKADFQSMMDEGWTSAKISEKCGVSVPTVANWKKKHGLAKPRKKRKGTAAVNATVRNPVKASSGSEAAKGIRGLLDMYEAMPDTTGSKNIRAAIRADMIDLVRSL